MSQTSLLSIAGEGVRGYILAFLPLFTGVVAFAWIADALGISGVWALSFSLGSGMVLFYLLLAGLSLGGGGRRILERGTFGTKFSTTLVMVLVMTSIPTILSAVTGSLSISLLPTTIMIFYVWTTAQGFLMVAVLGRITKPILSEELRPANPETKLEYYILGWVTPGLTLLVPGYLLWLVLQQSFPTSPSASLGQNLNIWTASLAVAFLGTWAFVSYLAVRELRHHRPQSAIFASALFTGVWGYVVYRASIVASGLTSGFGTFDPRVEGLLLILSIVAGMKFKGWSPTNWASSSISATRAFLLLSVTAGYLTEVLYIFLLQERLPLEPFVLSNVGGIILSLATLPVALRGYLSGEAQATPSPVSLARTEETKAGERHEVEVKPKEETPGETEEESPVEEVPPGPPEGEPDEPRFDSLLHDWRRQLEQG